MRKKPQKAVILLLISNLWNILVLVQDEEEGKEGFLGKSTNFL